MSTEWLEEGCPNKFCCMCLEADGLQDNWQKMSRDHNRPHSLEDYDIFLAISYFMLLLPPSHHHQILLLLVEHRASMKSFQALRSPAIPLTSFHGLLVLLISSSIVLRHVLFSLPLLLYP